MVTFTIFLLLVFFLLIFYNLKIENYIQRDISFSVLVQIYVYGAGSIIIVQSSIIMKEPENHVYEKHLQQFVQHRPTKVM